MSKQVHTYEGMSLTKQKYAASGLSDTEFAAQLTQELKRPYSVAQVRAYRKALGIENNKSPSLSKAAELEKAKALLFQVSSAFDPVSARQESLAQEIDEFLSGLQ